MGYPKTYADSRNNFKTALDAAEDLGFIIQRKSHAVANTASEELYTDVAYFPSTSHQTGLSRKLLVLTSGVHGAEGYTGSALLYRFISQELTPEMLESFSVLLVHNINPYGVFKNRRVNSNNVDLNRNFLLDAKGFQAENKDYQKFSDFLNPTSPASYGVFEKSLFFAGSLYKVATEGMKTLRQAIVGGQTQAPKGIFFRGQSQEPEVEVFSKILKSAAQKADIVFHIDLHTGYGKRGKLHFFSTNTLATKTDGIREKLFKGFELDTGKKEDFYKVLGDITQYTHDLLKSKTVLPMTFEFGTKDSQTIMGSHFSLRSVVLENQGFHNGFGSPTAEQAILKDFSELFNPSDEDWRADVGEQFSKTLRVVLPRFAEL